MAKPTTRAEARLRIVQMANVHRVRFGSRHGHQLRLLSLRQLSWAVFTVRQHHLLSDETLALAGFGPVKGRPS